MQRDGISALNLQLFFHAHAFGSAVVSEARGSSATSVPYTQRVPYLDKSLPSPHKLGRMQLSSCEELGNDDLVFLRFEPVKGFVPLIFQDWGAAVTTIELIQFKLGKKDVVRSLETKFDLEIQGKRERWPLYHASADNRWFFVLTVGENNSWEVKRCDLLLHKRELIHSSEASSTKLSFFRSWGQLTSVQYWGMIEIESNGNWKTIHKASMDDLDGEGEISKELIPPPDGVVAVSLPNVNFACAYRRNGSLIELELLEKSEAILQTHSNLESPKDFGKRVKSVLKCNIDLELKRISLEKQRRLQ